MRFSVSRALAAAGFAALLALTAACGGSSPAPKDPSSAPADETRVGSNAPDQAPVNTPEVLPDPPKSIAAAPAGGEIIPPFTTAKEGPASKKTSGAAAKPKKTAGKPKKKGAPT